MVLQRLAFLFSVLLLSGCPPRYMTFSIENDTGSPLVVVVGEQDYSVSLDGEVDIFEYEAGLRYADDYDIVDLYIEHEESCRKFSYSIPIVYIRSAIRKVENSPVDTLLLVIKEDMTIHTISGVWGERALFPVSPKSFSNIGCGQ
jgi:hypothetical protein